MRKVVLGVLCAVALAGCSDKKQEADRSSVAGAISPHAIQTITKSGYPKTFEKWGEDGVARINSLQPDAAAMIAKSAGCDALEILGLSDKSSPDTGVVFFGDCSNGSRFYVNENDIVAGHLASSQNEKSDAISDADYIALCHNGIRNRLKFPSTFDPGWFGTSVSRAIAGRVVVTVDFDAMNGSGGEIPQRGKCFFDGGTVFDYEISDR